MILLLAAENPYDLLPTIRSRAVSFHLAPLSNAEMQAFVAERGLSDAERRIALAAGSPGLAVSMDLEVYDERRTAMLKLLEVAAGRAPFAEWAKYAEAMAPRKTEKLDASVEHPLRPAGGRAAVVRRARARSATPTSAAIWKRWHRRVSFRWIRAAVDRADELSTLVRRNIQKSIALDALVVELRGLAV